MKKQTAVEWLVQQINSDCLNSIFITPTIVEQARLIEKEQIVEAFKIGMDMWAGFTPEDYFNKTYEK